METMKKKRKLETSADASGRTKLHRGSKMTHLTKIIKDDRSNKNNQITKHQLFHSLQDKKL